MECVIAAACKVVELLIPCIWRKIGYVIHYKDNIQNLGKQAETLKNWREMVLHSVEEAKSMGENILTLVTDWEKDAEDATETAGKILEDSGRKGHYRCLMGWCPDWKSRCQFGREAIKQVEVVVNLQNTGHFVRVSYRTAPHYLVSELVSFGLLLEGKDSERVKMHDIFYNFSRSVADKEHHVFNVAYDGVLDEWPDSEEFKQFTAISLPYCKFPDFPREFECPKLESFILYSTDDGKMRLCLGTFCF